jgi:hypothetical protein
VDVNDTVSITGLGADVRERRRIEIRLRKSDKIVILPPGALATFALASIPRNKKCCHDAFFSGERRSSMAPTTRSRVPDNTNESVNEDIQRQIEERVRYYAGHPGEIPRRLRELDQEWDIERAIEANAAVVGFGGVLLGGAVDRRWLALPALVTGFLFQHAVQGWCPPVPILRRLGFRTAHAKRTCT